MGKKLQLFIQSYKITYSTMSISQFDLAISELVAFISIFFLMYKNFSYN